LWIANDIRAPHKYSSWEMSISADHSPFPTTGRERIQTTAFSAEQALTKDTVPVNVDAIIFWHAHDARNAALNITDYRRAIDRVAQTLGHLLGVESCAQSA
jgi:hypothetical protein